MNKDTVETIIDVENELLAHIGAEREKAGEWIESVRSDWDSRVQQERLRLAESAAETRKEIRKIALKRAAQISDEAHRKAKRMGALDETALSTFLRQHLRVILPSP